MEKNTDRVKTVLSVLLIGSLAVSVAFLLRGWLGGHFESVETLQEYVASFGMLAPFALAFIQALQVVIPVMPGFVGCLAGASMFGAAGGFWCNYIGITGGSLLAFFLARRYGVSLVRKIIPPDKYEKLAAWVNGKKSYALVLFLAFLLPLTPDDYLCYLSGLTGMSARRFTWIAVLSKPWCILAYSVGFSLLF